MSMTKDNQSSYRTTVGYFRDPWTDEKFTGKEERVDTTGLYPKIRDSKGNIIPLTFSLWTQEEKNIYYNARREGRGNGRGNGTSQKDKELRDGLTALETFLGEVLTGKDLEDARVLIGNIMPEDPEIVAKKRKIEALEAQLASLKASL